MAPLVRVFIGLFALVLCGLPSAALADRWAAEPGSGQVWAAATDLAYLRAAPDLLSEAVGSMRKGT